MRAQPILRSLALGVACLSAWATFAWGQRPLAGKFDAKQTIELSGVVTNVDWRNPQGHIFMNVTGGAAKGKAAEVVNWAIEIDTPSLLELDGWSRETLHPGDRITVKGIRARDGSRQAYGQEIRLASGAQIFYAKAKPSRVPLTPRATPRWPDGKPALGAIPGGVDGYWTDPSKVALVEDGVNVAMDQNGLLANLADASKVAPMQPWALGLYQHRQARQLQDDPLFINCKPPGGPRQYQSRLGVQFIEDKATQRIFVLMGSGNHNFRIIFLDGREQKGYQGGDDDNPLYYGRSVGKWEGDTLVVSTVGFNEDFWFTQGGLPHTDLLRLTERFTRPDHETLRYEVTVDDPGAYTRNWSASWTMKWNGGAILPSHFCQNNRP